MSWRLAAPATATLRAAAHGVAGLALLAMLGITIVDILSRYVLNRPIPGVIDVVELCMIWTTMLGIATAWAERAHIVVDLIDAVVGPAVVAALDGAARALAIVAMAALAWLAWDEWRNSVAFGDRTPDLGIPVSWFWTATLAGYGLSLLVLIARPRGAPVDD